MQSNVFLIVTIGQRDKEKTRTVQQNKTHRIKVNGFLPALPLPEVFATAGKPSLVTQIVS